MDADKTMLKLQGIATKVSEIEDRLTTRLPHQRALLAASVCAWKWHLLTMQKLKTESEYDAYASGVAKRLRIELSAFDYRTKEQAELLTRHLCELDDILSLGKSEIKDTRKAMVVRIQTLLTQADEMKHKSSQLTAFGGRVLATLPSVATPPASPHVALGAEQQQEHQQNEEEVAEETNQEDEELEGEEDDEEMDELEVDQQTEAMDDGEEEEEETQNAVDEKTSEMEELDIDVNSLPVWKPYYQIQRHSDGLHLIAKLHGVDRRNVRVQWTTDAGILRVTGFKLPTRKDITLTQFSGVSTFGRFEIVQQLPVRSLNMDEATQQLHEDGTLDIHMPYYFVQHPRILRRASPFEMVW